MLKLIVMRKYLEKHEKIIHFVEDASDFKNTTHCTVIVTKY